MTSAQPWTLAASHSHAVPVAVVDVVGGHRQPEEVSAEVGVDDFSLPSICVHRLYHVSPGVAKIQQAACKLVRQILNDTCDYGVSGKKKHRK